MTDIIEGARALLAESAKYSSHPWSVRGTVHTIVWDARGLDVAEAATSEDAALIAAAPRLLAALADECERLRKQNSEYHRRTQVAEAAVLEETTRGHRLGRSVGRSLANAAASTAMRECERLRDELVDARRVRSEAVSSFIAREEEIDRPNKRITHEEAKNARLLDEVPTKAIDVLIGLLPATLYAQERNALSAVRLWLIGLSRLDAAKEVL